MCLKYLFIWQMLHLFHLGCGKACKHHVSRQYGNQKLSDFTSPFAAPPRLHAAILADRLHPAAGDVEHTSIQVGYILHALVSYKRNWRHLAPLLSYCSENHRLQFSVEGTVEMFVLLLGRFF